MAVLKCKPIESKPSKGEEKELPSSFLSFLYIKASNVTQI